MRMFTGDLKPDLEITLSGSTPVDTSTATGIRIIGKRGDLIVFDRAPATVTTVGDTAVVTMEWQTGDTTDVGTIAIEVEVTWPGIKPQTFRPSAGVNVVKDFDHA